MKKKVDELVAEDIRLFHLEMVNDKLVSLNIDNALVYISAKRGKLNIIVIDRGRLTVRMTP